MFPKRILGSPTNYSKPFCVCDWQEMCNDTYRWKLGVRELSSSYQALSLPSAMTLAFHCKDPGSKPTVFACFCFHCSLIAGGERKLYLSMLPVTLFLFCFVAKEQTALCGQRQHLLSWRSHWCEFWLAFTLPYKGSLSFPHTYQIGLSGMKYMPLF